MTIGIYQIKRIGTDDVYIGSSVNIERRWTLHRTQLRKNKHHSDHLQRVFNRYGFDILEFSIIEEALIDALLDREQYYIDFLNPIYNTYKDVRQVPNLIDKIRKAQTGKKRSQETKDKIAAALLGNTNGKNRAGIKMSDESKDKMRQAKLGMKRGPMPEETKRKISETQKGKPREYAVGSKRSEETKAKMSAALKGKGIGRKASEKTRRRMSESQKKRFK